MMYSNRSKHRTAHVREVYSEDLNLYVINIASDVTQFDNSSDCHDKTHLDDP